MMMPWDNKFCLLLMLVVFGACLQAADSGSVDWQAFYRSLPVPVKDTNEDDDGSTWSSSSGSSSEEEEQADPIVDRGDFDVVVRDLKNYKKFIAHPPTGPMATYQQKLNRQLKRSIDNRIKQSESKYPLINSFVQAAAADQNYEQIVDEIDNEANFISSEVFAEKQHDIVKQYAACKTDKAAVDFLKNYKEAGKSLSITQKEAIQNSIVSEDELDTNIISLAKEYRKHGDDYLNSYVNESGQILSFLQKQKIKSKFLTQEEFEDLQNEILVQYLKSPPFTKPLIFKKEFDGKMMLPSQVEVIKNLALNVPADLLINILATSFINRGQHEGNLNADQVQAAMRRFGIVSDGYDIESLVKSVNDQINERFEQRRQKSEAMRKVVDHFSSTTFTGLTPEQLRSFLDAQGLLAGIGDFDSFYHDAKSEVKKKSDHLKQEEKRQAESSPYILPAVFNRIKSNIIKLYAEFAKYPGVREIILHGTLGGKPLSKEQQDEIKATLSLDGIEQVEKIVSVTKTEDLVEMLGSLRNLCIQWNDSNLSIWKRRFSMEAGLVLSDIPNVYKMLNNEGIAKYLSSGKHSHELTAAEFKAKKAEIFAVYKQYKNNPMFLNIHLRNIIGSKKLTASQIAELNTMMGGGQEDTSGDEEGSSGAGGASSQSGTTHSSGDHADEHVAGQVHELMQLNQTLIMIQA